MQLDIQTEWLSKVLETLDLSQPAFADRNPTIFW
jgi:hypothetical protein